MNGLVFSWKKPETSLTPSATEQGRPSAEPGTIRGTRKQVLSRRAICRCLDLKGQDLQDCGKYIFVVHKLLGLWQFVIEIQWTKMKANQNTILFVLNVLLLPVWAKQVFAFLGSYAMPLADKKINIKQNSQEFNKHMHSTDTRFTAQLHKNQCNLWFYLVNYFLRIDLITKCAPYKNWMRISLDLQ